MKKILLIILTLMSFCPFMINAEELVEIQLEHNEKAPVLEDIMQTSSGGYIGYANISEKFGDLDYYGYDDAYIVNYNQEGKILWQKTWGGSSNDEIKDILITSDDNVIVIIETCSTDIEGITNKGSYDVVILKYDSEGNLLWYKTWGGNQTEIVNFGVLLENDSFVVVGKTYSKDVPNLYVKNYNENLIVKYDKNGNMLWQQTWGGEYSDGFYSGSKTENDSFVLVGYLRSPQVNELVHKGAEYDGLIIKFDNNGNILWEKNYGGSKRDWFYSVKYIEDDGLIVAGESDSSDIEGVNIIGNGYNDAIVIKYDENGNILWENSWGGNYRDYFKEIEIDNDGNILMIGKTESKDIEGIDYNYFADSIIVKYDKNGELMWNKNFNDENLNGYETVNITSILMLNDNSFLLTTEYYFDDDGSKNYYETNNGLITKYDKNGNKKWQKEWIGNKIDFFKKFFINENNELLAFLISNSNLDEENLEYNDWTEYCMPIKYYFNFTIENKTTKNGTSPVEQQGSQAIITPTPVQGYEVDQIIIKDKNGEVLDLEVTKLEDGTYSFALFTDVSVEVTFKAKIENPKTGILDVMTILIIGFIMSITGIFVVKNYNERYEI